MSSGTRTFCDLGQPGQPATFWGAREETGDQNTVAAFFKPSNNGVFVRNDYVPASGSAGGSQLECSSPSAEWSLFKAKLGTKRDRVDLAAKPPLPGLENLTQDILARIELGSGNDVAIGHAGTDVVSGGRGKDGIATGAGRDLVKVRGGGRDRVACGRGRDKVVADERDDLAGCEIRRVR